MCISSAALALFLTVLGPEMVSSEPGLYIVHAEVGDAHWVQRKDHEDMWCTDAPQVEARDRRAVTET